VTSSEAKVDALRSRGADDVIVSKDGRFQAEVLARTGGHGVDVALECVGGPTFQGSLRSVAPSGRLVLVGNVTGERVELNLGQVILYSRQILGSDGATRRELCTVLEMAAAGEIRPQIADVWPLERAAQAQERLGAREVLGRIVLEPARPEDSN
jgi:NADPH:quinone reductase-like Zn-dependent oxidoreductase